MLFVGERARFVVQGHDEAGQPVTGLVRGDATGVVSTSVEGDVVTVSGDVAEGAPVASEVTDPRAGRRLYDPGHPDADADGFVTYPNVDVNTELVDLMVARRVFEANATVFQAAKSMLRRALEI